jgi:hypothetical protein
MAETTVVERKPFHEAVVEMLKQASDTDLEALGSLLLRTVIPKGHDEIVGAWNARCAELCWSPESAQFVAKDILRHKRDIKAKAEAKKRENPLDRFRLADEKHA